jgi:hypothetical protein
MTLFKILFLANLVIISSAQARIDLTGSEDALPLVAKKLMQIEEQLKNQRIFVTTASFNWPELTAFREDLLFVVAHDPFGSVKKDLPKELLPTNLTERLRVSFSKLEASAYQIGTFIKSEEWTVFKNDMDVFLKHRDEHLYVPARGMIRSGLLLGNLNKLNDAAALLIKGDITSQNISLRVIDPVIEKLSQELEFLNVSVHKLQEYNKPLPIVPKTIFQEKNIYELGLLAAVALSLGFLVTILVQWTFKILSKPAPIPVVITKPEGFDYYEWLKRLEANLNALKNNEEKLTEEHINLKNLGVELSQSREGLNMAENQQEYYLSLEQLNSSAPRLEEYFDKFDIKKNGEQSRRLVKLVVQLCDAIETRQEITFVESKGRGKVPRVDSQILDMKAA